MVTMKILWSKMAVVHSTRGISETLTGLVAPSKSLPVPNHLLDTKIFPKVSLNDVLQAKPSVVHFAGFQVGGKHFQVLNIVNVSSETQRMHILPPSTKYFYIKYTKNERFVPGLSVEVTIEFKPDEWRYYYDCIRIHSKAEENLLIPIHAYPVMSSLKLPKDVNFASVPLGESKTKAIPLRSEIPIDFEFQIRCLQPNIAFTVNPLSGIVPGNGEAQILVTYTPFDFSTSIMKLQLFISQFNSEPQICTFTGISQPGQTKELKERTWEGNVPDLPQSKILDPVLIDPLNRTRVRKLKTKPWLPGQSKPKEILKDGYRISASGINSAYAVATILNQQQGKLKAKDIRQAVQDQKAVPNSSKQMKETMFEYQVHQNVLEERQNQLRWCVRLGEDAFSDSSETKILGTRNKTDTEYKLLRGDPVIESELNRSSTGCQLRRIHRQADDIPKHEPKFDVLVNDEWSKRHMVIKRFVQAGRKVIIRSRATKNIRSLTELLSGWRKGKFCTDQTRRQMAESEEENIFFQLPSRICAAWVNPFSFPAYKSPDIKDDLDFDALDTLTVQSTIVKVRTHIPYYNLKVPKQYCLRGYNPHSVAAASSGYVTPKLMHTLRKGAQDEVVSLTSNVPVSSTMSQSPGFGYEDEDMAEDEIARGVTSSSFRSHVMDLPDETAGAMTDPEVAPLVVPAALFNPLPYHPMHIFNPAPGLQVFKQQLPYSEVDEDYHLCPLPRHRQPSKGSSRKPGRQYLERQDVIPSVMTWKRFPCQLLVSIANHPTLSTVWLPRWSDSFGEDLLPTKAPQLLGRLPDDDMLSDDEVDDEDIALKEVSVPTPEMVHAQFPKAEKVPAELQTQHPPTQLSDMMISVSTKQQQPINSTSSDITTTSRDQREKELSDFVKQRQNRLGTRISQRVTSMHDLLSSCDLMLK